MTNPSLLEARVVEVEMQLMHLQNDYEQLNAECLRQQSLSENQRQRVERLETLVRQLCDRLDSSGHESLN